MKPSIIRIQKLRGELLFTVANGFMVVLGAKYCKGTLEAVNIVTLTKEGLQEHVYVSQELFNFWKRQGVKGGAIPGTHKDRIGTRNN